MSDHNPDVAAVLAEAQYREPVDTLAALTAAGYAVVKLPEGMAVVHGARLVYAWPYDKRDTYAIEGTP